MLNADDPLIADLGRGREVMRGDGDGDRDGGDDGVLYFGVEDDSLALPGMAHAADAKHCRRCGRPTCSTPSISAIWVTTTARAAGRPGWRRR